jgi:RNA polymerase sigma-70 factor (ECF subfamily)
MSLFVLRAVAAVQESARLPMTRQEPPRQGPSPSDEELVRRAQGGRAGDGVADASGEAGARAAFEALVRRYQKPLYFLCYRYVRDHDAAADLTQRTFIRVMEKLQDLRDGAIFRSWLFRIGVNLALNYLRDHSRFVDEATMVNSGDEPVAAPEAMSHMEAAEDAEALREAVAQLPTKQRMTLELRIYEELSFKDIAAALETTEGAAKVNFHYAVRKLRSLFGGTPASKLGTS